MDRAGDMFERLTTVRPWGETADGPVHLYTLKNRNGMTVEIINFGGNVVRMTARNRAGFYEDVVLGLNSVKEYAGCSAYLGCIVGRYANRIANGRFALDGVEYELAKNNAPNGIPCALHGGVRGFDKRLWRGRAVFHRDTPGVEMRYASPGGEEGYPGTLAVKVVYWLTNDDELRIEYHAATDEATPINLTNHSSFNLKGEGEGTILDHEVMINAKHFTVVDKGLIPTGEIRKVEGTALDFTKPMAIGARIDSDDGQLRFAGGYDLNYVLDGGPDGEGLRYAARVYEPQAGRVMDVYTTEPGLQFYSGNFLEGDIVGKAGRAYEKHGGFCLETQHFPDSPNQPDFPNTILRPGEDYRSVTIYRFSTE